MGNPQRSVGLFVLTSLVAGRAPSQPDPPSGGGALRDEIVARERAGLDALKVGDLSAFAASIAEEAVFVDAHGPAGKAQVVKTTAAFRLTAYTMSDIRFVPLAKNSGLIVYHMEESGNSHGRDFTAQVHVSSIWLKRRGKWLCMFSQETMAR
jgi:ketosteroid isomerase-like protein